MEIIAADTQEKLEQCLRIRHEVFTIERKVPEEIEVDAHDCLCAGYRHFLVRDGEKYVGAFRCEIADLYVVRIQRFCILKAHRGQGLAREALALTEELCRKKQRKRIELDAKYEVCGFYEKCGYVRESSVFEEAGVPHVKMAKDL